MIIDNFLTQDSEPAALAKSVYVPSKTESGLIGAEHEFADNVFWDLKHSSAGNYDIDDLL